MMRPTLLFAALSACAATKTNSNLRRLVAVGVNAGATEFPTYGKALPWSRCGGTLVAPDMVLTAASCSDKFKIGDTFALGGNQLIGNDASESFKIAATYPHISYDSETSENDLMLFRLDGQSVVQFSPFSTDTAAPVENAPTTVIGYGNVAPPPEFNVLQKATVAVVKTDDCNVPGFYDGKVLGDMFCAGAGNGACTNGDEGGPLFDAAQQIVGVFSFGNSCGAGATFPGVYTKVANYRIWMEQVICSNSKGTPQSFCTALGTASPTATPVTPGTCLGGITCTIFFFVQAIAAVLATAGVIGLLFLR